MHNFCREASADLESRRKVLMARIRSETGHIDELLSELLPLGQISYKSSTIPNFIIPLELRSLLIFAQVLLEL